MVAARPEELISTHMHLELRVAWGSNGIVGGLVQVEAKV